MRAHGALLLACTLLPIILVFEVDAHAGPITFSYEGAVNNTQGGSAFDAFLGETLRIDYTFDSNATDSNSNPDIGTGQFQVLRSVSRGLLEFVLLYPELTKL